MMVTNNDTTDATLTEYLTAAETDDSIEGPAAVEYIKVGQAWHTDDAQILDNNPDEYRAVCSCGAEFGNWGAATRHAEKEH
jgi:hypothetical protein